MNSNRYQYTALEGSNSQWTRWATVAVAVSMGAVCGLVLSATGDSTSLYAATTTTPTMQAIPTARIQGAPVPQLPRQAAVGAPAAYSEEGADFAEVAQPFVIENAVFLLAFCVFLSLFGVTCCMQ